MGGASKVEIEVRGAEAVRLDIVDDVVEERLSVLLSEKNRLVELDRFGFANPFGGEDMGGELGPRRSLRRCRALSQSVHGCV